VSKLQAFYFHDFKNSYLPHILKEIYIDRIYDQYTYGKKDLTIVDLGSNIGITNFYFKDYAKRLIAVEPSKDHITTLKTMHAQNDMNVEIYPYAVSSQNGKTRFYHNENTTMFSLRGEVNDKGKHEEVETKTLEQLMTDLKVKHIDILKMDIEGSEYDLIVSDGFSRVADKIDLILGEFHTWSGVNPHQFATTFIDYGFDFQWMNATEASTFVAKKK
jgi:FkbM family methyltransferase